MAGVAIADRGEFAAALDQIRVEVSARGGAMAAICGRQATARAAAAPATSTIAAMPVMIRS
ncbi:hypothetical protein [Bradyrhizobium pachyrhizi]|uniref:hypothetical protein n=1 Tax=Bradyrhizobium pachyrhizi TaxID=280333 RepID=UPI001FD2BC50|nr:hypothetical protein [Bradyrhizobium pachyrhizi]